MLGQEKALGGHNSGKVVDIESKISFMRMELASFSMERTLRARFKKVTRYDVYAIGAALLDIEVAVSEVFLHDNVIKKGVMTLVDEARQAQLITALDKNNNFQRKTSGGSACNTLVAAASFGATAFFSGKVADDGDGKHFVNDLVEAGVAFHRATPEQGITGKCLVMVTDDAERTLNTFLGASELLSDKEINLEALLESEWLYIEGYLLTDDARTSLVSNVVSKAKSAGVKVALSLSDPFVAQIFGENIRTVIDDGIDLIFCNKDESLAFANTESIDEAFEVLANSAKMFAVTDGAAGVVIFNGSTTIKVPGVPTNAVDTNGAGDMFAGAFLYAVTAGRDLKWAAELANESASRVVSKFGPRLDTQDFVSIKQKFGI